MEMSLFEVAGEKYTRFKILRSQYSMFKKILGEFGIVKPSKISSRYVYFEAEGDFLNNKRSEN